ncbi:Eco57I restriction-modification methylase domain-containing protein [Macrococcus equi]|uniref:Eco57I restriction-modification methylase domain-containing protein n=1 Tax=Macrococcus equi TaxID=3395462 RepID=UPI0039BE706D
MKHQIFTTEALVDEMLNAINYKYNILNKKVIDSACGNGEILTKIVQRYIEDAKARCLESSKIKKGIENNIYGFEIDKVYFDECIDRLNSIANEHGLYNINWSIYNKDYLQESTQMKFDFIVGNPPYIKYHDINKEDRELLKSKYITCRQGNFDYYYAFLEKDYLSLKDEGQLIYLIPVNTFKNVFAKTLRNLIKKDVVKILDYRETKLFKNILTTSAIVQIKKNINSDSFKYVEKKQNQMMNINKKTLKDIWYFNDEFNKIQLTHKFGDYFKASMSVATLKNDVYILKKFIESENYIICDNYKLEKDILREAVSPRSMRSQEYSFIIFPYKVIDGSIELLSENYIKKEYPNTFKYLLNNKETLSTRKISSSSKWYEYGRNQAISNMNKRKLMLSTIITNKVNVYDIKEKTVVYSGICVYSISDIDLSVAKNILQSIEFFEYIKLIGVNTSGSSYRISAKDINNFPLNKSLEEY